MGSPIPPILVEPPTNETTEVSGPYPTLVAAEGGDKTIPIVTAMWASRYLGVLNVSWTPTEGMLSAVGAPVLLGGANSTNPVAGAALAQSPLQQRAFRPCFRFACKPELTLGHPLLVCVHRRCVCMRYILLPREERKFCPASIVCSSAPGCPLPSRPCRGPRHRRRSDRPARPD